MDALIPTPGILEHTQTTAVTLTAQAQGRDCVDAQIFNHGQPSPHGHAWITPVNWLDMTTITLSVAMRAGSMMLTICMMRGKFMRNMLYRCFAEKMVDYETLKMVDYEIFLCEMLLLYEAQVGGKAVTGDTI